MTNACFSSVPFDTAVAICEADNARICAAAEINSDCTIGIGRSYVTLLSWASTVLIVP